MRGEVVPIVRYKWFFSILEVGFKIVVFGNEIPLLFPPSSVPVVNDTHLSPFKHGHMN